MDRCQKCQEISGTLYYADRSWYCKMCRPIEDSQFPYIKEMGTENPFDPKGSTAHVRDIKQRRWHPKEKRMFRYNGPKSYFFSK